jgi:hemerythrin-like domain-containing protein
MSTNHNRRFFLLRAAATAGAAVAMPLHPMAAEDSSQEEKEVEISAPEDLMREHGVLDRILLIFEHGTRRLRHKEDVPPEVFLRPAELVRQFIEDYHEKLEERFIFPRFEENGQLLDLVRVLKDQHRAGRALTDNLLRDAAPSRFTKPEARDSVAQTVEAFIRMYRPHEAREETVLFPALYEIAGEKNVKELGEQFEEEEHRLFGNDGFKATVEKVAEIEKQLGIYELSSFTPK